MDSSGGIARVEGRFFFSSGKIWVCFEYWRRFSHIHEIENIMLEENIWGGKILMNVRRDGFEGE